MFKGIIITHVNAILIINVTPINLAQNEQNERYFSHYIMYILFGRTTLSNKSKQNLTHSLLIRPTLAVIYYLLYNNRYMREKIKATGKLKLHI